ncbi:MAG: DNA translocase SpoIIIE [Chloroflexi bacterium]|nr:DNA translocase SpoIIIE [Chloroflexota bacterium]
MSKKPKDKKNKRIFAQKDAPAWLAFLSKLWFRFEHFAFDIGGILVLALSLMTLLAILLPELVSGSVLLKWANFLRHVVGWGSLFIIALGGGIGLWMLRQRAEHRPPIKWKRVLALEIAIFSLIVLMTILGGHDINQAEKGQAGGMVGWGLVEILSQWLGLWGTGIVSVLGIFWGGMIGLNLTTHLTAWGKKTLSAAGSSPDSTGGGDVPGSAVTPPPRKEPSPRAQRLPPEFRKKFRVSADEDEPVSPPPRNPNLPSLDLLGSGRSARPDERHINTTAGLIEKTLSEFGIPAEVVGFQVGPTVTQFAVKPGYLNGAGEGEEDDEEKKKVRVSKITSLEKDLTLALSADRLRIEAPVPGRPYIGIEVPNAKSALVRLRPLLESKEFYTLASPLAIALGRDVSGAPIVADLAQMPHLLIAGTTGSGKSVCITSLTTCLVMNNTPAELRLVMIDPKMVELVRFNGLPHLYGKVETDLERILSVLQWVVAEMDRRYKFLEETSSRNIDTYNRKMRRRKKSKPLPRIVVMLDELADLMMMAPGQTEHSLVRLAQMARATGIHLVVATQRPSTDVVTGLIKANFPARLSFAVASGVDSRVILDTGGAESLLGNGDMLFLSPEKGSPLRAQGALVSNKELEKVISDWQKRASVEDESPPWEKMIAEQAALEDYDELVKKAFKIVRDSQQGSTSMIQRKLRIGYPRASRLMSELEELGYVGPSQGSGKEREVFIAPDEDFAAT